MSSLSENRYTVTALIPARQVRIVVDAASYEQAAKDAKDKLGVIDDVVVTEMGVEDAQDKEVYGWCESCGLPVWLDDDRDTYHSKVDPNDRTLPGGVIKVSHNACKEHTP